MYIIYTTIKNIIQGFFFFYVIVRLDSLLQFLLQQGMFKFPGWRVFLPIIEEILETTLELLGEFSNGLPSTPCFGQIVQLCHPPSGWEALEGHWEMVGH